MLFVKPAGRKTCRLFLSQNFYSMIQEYFKGCRTEEELQKEHRKLVIQMHPDRNSDDPEATAKFQEMQAQYEEKKAELHGDYRAAAKGRARRAQAEREKPECDKRCVEEVINQARKNRDVGFGDLKAGDYVYARCVENDGYDDYVWETLQGEGVVNVAYRCTPKQETVVKIEKVYELCDDNIMYDALCSFVDGVYGGYEVLQTSDFNGNGKRVPKVVMFRSPHYCIFGNPKGDFVISDYYVTLNYEEMFADQFIQLDAERKRQEEKKRIEAERMARLEAEQKPLMDEWTGKLVTISAALTDKEKEAVAIDNLMTMLKTKFPGVKFRLKDHMLYWQDGPMCKAVHAIMDLFSRVDDLRSPWENRFGHFDCILTSRTMSALTVTSILDQLGQITDAFATSGYADRVEVGDTDWMLMHLLVGVNVMDGEKQKCWCDVKKKTRVRMVSVKDAVEYIFDRTSYKPKKGTAKRKKATKVA